MNRFDLAVLAVAAGATVSFAILITAAPVAVAQPAATKQMQDAQRKAEQKAREARKQAEQQQAEPQKQEKDNKPASAP
ncbi:conserved exported hypothetical protein [Paraburkholderia piptadeniae]|uniref:Uncharacterized protein n=1 Tax=Paraburkholderia piptadeniae TaxID=1701573 RepID=A0A1N7RKS1_9BURK|nr:hypothetical protein [Paraburkholderia piptadeniae]SIT35718.1 conserved exported hypothetical protein [Paraburkholderia piptadeniae]